MNRRSIPLFFVLAFLLAACVPAAGTQPASSDAGTTVVASTPQESSNLLPRRLYFLGKDSQSLTQVFRLERDGKTQTQLTSEPVNILDFVVSSQDGSLVYEINNRLILLDAGGSNRRVLAEGDPRPVERGFDRPVFSPDGKTLAYAFGGLNLYNLSTGTNVLAVADRPLDPSPTESYLPESFSPDGTKLLVHMTHTDTASLGVYDLTANSLVRFADKTDSDFACCGIYSEFAWAPDGASFYAANPLPGVDVGGLWKVDAATGTATTLVPYGSDNNTLNFLDEPFAAPDGQLYYFYANYDGNLGPLHRAPVDLEIDRSGPDGVTGRTTLARSDTLRFMNEALWAPDAGFAIVALAPAEDVMDGGQAEIVYFDGRPNVVLAPFAQEMKWGP